MQTKIKAPKNKKKQKTMDNPRKHKNQNRPN